MRITQGTFLSLPKFTDEEIKAVAATNISGEALYMKVIVCFRHLRCICRKRRKGRDYSWHLQHLLREFGCGPLADLATAPLANPRNTTIIKRWLLQFLEHGTVPAVVLALAIAPTDSRIWKRHDFTQPTNRGIEILFMAPTTDRMTLASKDYELTVVSTKALPLPAHPRTASR